MPIDTFDAIVVVFPDEKKISSDEALSNFNGKPVIKIEKQ